MSNTIGCDCTGCVNQDGTCRRAPTAAPDLERRCAEIQRRVSAPASPPVPATVLGMTVKVDPSMPPDEVSFQDKHGNEMGRIVGIAAPVPDAALPDAIREALDALDRAYFAERRDSYDAARGRLKSALRDEVARVSDELEEYRMRLAGALTTAEGAMLDVQEREDTIPYLRTCPTIAAVVKLRRAFAEDEEALRRYIGPARGDEPVADRDSLLAQIEEAEGREREWRDGARKCARERDEAEGHVRALSADLAEYRAAVAREKNRAESAERALAEARAERDDIVGKLHGQLEWVREKRREARAEVERLRRAMDRIILNDKTSYHHHEARPSDGAKPSTDGGTCWLTPREIATAALSVPPGARSPGKE